jgi:hypothetical protein
VQAGVKRKTMNRPGNSRLMPPGFQMWNRAIMAGEHSLSGRL